jgi:hypothetical protein
LRISSFDSFISSETQSHFFDSPKRHARVTLSRLQFTGMEATPTEPRVQLTPLEQPVLEWHLTTWFEHPDGFHARVNVGEFSMLLHSTAALSRYLESLAAAFRHAAEMDG